MTKVSTTSSTALALRSLDMEFITFTSTGVSDFLWPCPTGHFRPFRDYLANRLVTATRAMRDAGTPGSDGLAILLHHLTLEVLSVYYCTSVVNEFAALGWRISAPPRSRTLSAVAAGVAPPPPTIKQILNKGPLKPARWRLPMRIARDLYVTNCITRRRLSEPDYKHDIIAASISPLMEAHARSIDRRVTFRRPHIWFNNETSRASTGDSDGVVETIVEIVQDAFAESHTSPAAWLANSLRNWLGPAITQTERWLHAIERKPSRLPQHLWVGSGGDIWTRILRYAVQRSGGHVTAHDHGSGTGQFIGEMHNNIIEFDFCDRFITFTEAQAEGLRCHHLDHRFLMRDDAPEFGAPITSSSKCMRAPTRQKNSRKTIMLISSWYFTDWVTHQAFISDIAYLDFEVRLLAHLQDWGYEIIYKPHPLIVTRPPADFAARFGGREENRPSEQVIHDADILILTDPSSTAFATSLASQIPAVFVDFGLFLHTDAALTALKKRCAIIRAPGGSDQRISIDWNDLRCAIADASSPSSDDYVRLFHRNTG